MSKKQLTASEMAKKSHKNRTKKDYEVWWKAGVEARKKKREEQNNLKNEQNLQKA